MPENAIYRIAKSWTSDVLFPKDIPQENVNIPVFVKEGLLVREGIDMWVRACCSAACLFVQDEGVT